MGSPIYSSSPSKHLTVIDVYDLAESINRDFEKLAEKFGNEPFDSVVRKVLSALETLEALAKHNDSEVSETMELQKTIERFEQEKRQRLRDKENLEKDFIDLEENYKREIDELCKIVQKLKAENKSMREEISNNSLGRMNENAVELGEPAEEQFQVLMDLRKLTQTQKERIKELQKDLDSYCEEVETLRAGIERLIRQNKELLRKNSSLQKQGRILLLERAEILNRLEHQEEEALYLRKILGETSRACKDLEMHQQRQEMEESPRFTLSELREVLKEKNSLKARVLELEERIDHFRGGSSTASDIELRKSETPPTENASVVSPASPTALVSKSGSSQEIKPTGKEQIPNSEGTDECLVFGPINREPEDKLHPWKYDRKESGVRKFFRLFKVSLSTNLSPRGSSSAKLAESIE